MNLLTQIEQVVRIWTFLLLVAVLIAAVFEAPLFYWYIHGEIADRQQIQRELKYWNCRTWRECE